MKKLLAVLSVFVLSLTLAACGGAEETGEVLVDGSSTVFPITEAVAEEFRVDHPGVRVPIGVSGTGGGFTKFCAGETDINNASRPIKDKEKANCEANGIEVIELTVAFDGLTVVINNDNDWATDITVDELNQIWKPGSTVSKWSDVRSEWPDKEISLYGPGSASGTFDYFTDEINGESGAIRTDYTPSEDDDVLVTGVKNDQYSMGFFGYAYYLGNKESLKSVAIDNGSGAVSPTFETIQDGSYAPLSRPLFIYVNKSSLEEEAVRNYVEFYLGEGTDFIEDVGYVKLSDSHYESELNKLN
ncbi:PstS family phosphate ABC transporter substrate-binding protein [Haloplasma contractile]|uniref:Phosphate-binding protein n=1 Tax=Haloplasma contractile SSD-17B TaxID=1033810 RepID=F7PSK3_9MOLU|nr:PstS family phosphate ABC transporter substrate-binding protein [Haloplasma contractile]ERJ12605.1 Phosphate binding protein [Haloplasma contractile SSD-17B]